MNWLSPRRSRNASARIVVAIEALELRQLLSSTTLRIGAYNIEDDISGYSTPRSGLYAVLEAIGTYNAGSGARPIDVMGLEETTSNSTTVQPILTALNSYYGAGTYATSTVQGSESGGDTADGNGPNAVIYNTKTVTLLQTYGLTGSLGSSTGMYRQVMRYEFQAVGGTSASDFYIYVDHAKSGTTSADLTARANEAALIRKDEATLPSTARVIYMGDFNSSGTSDASISDLLASGQGQAIDPAGVTGTWSKSSSALKVLSETDTALDYRDDLLWNTTNVATDASGLQYVSGTYTTFGNNGSVAIGKSVNSSSNTALSSLSNGSTILADLTTASDHLPVFADYTVPLTSASTPTIGTFSAAPATVASGNMVTLTATGVTDSGSTISKVTFYRESNGTSGFQSTDTVVGTGTASGTTYKLALSTSGLAAGSYTYYAVATDANGVSTAALTAASSVVSSPSIASFAVTPASATVGSTLTFTASGVADAGGTISSLKIYRESNSTTGYQSTDTLVGTATGSSGTYTLSASSTGLSAGTYTYYAVATDTSSVVASASATQTLTTALVPTIGSFAVSPTSTTVGASVLLKATSVAESGGSISSVKFYRESNGTTGYQSTDTLIGTATGSSGTYTLSTSTTGLSVGTYTFYAVATDAKSTTATASTTLSLTTSGSTTTTSGTLLAWEVSGQTNYGKNGLAASTVAAADTNSLGLTKGSGVAGTSGGASKAWGGTSWASTSSTGLSASKYITFGLTVASGHTESLSSIDLFYRRSSTGPANGLWQYQLNSGTWVTLEDVSNLFPNTTSTGASMAELNLSGVSNLQGLAAGSVVNFRLTPYGATATAGTFYIYNHTGNDLSINGSYTSTAAATVKTAAVFSDAAITSGDDAFWN